METFTNKTRVRCALFETYYFNTVKVKELARNWPYKSRFKINVEPGDLKTESKKQLALSCLPLFETVTEQVQEHLMCDGDDGKQEFLIKFD